MHPKQIAVLGLGYVGCVSAASLASLGHIVVGADTDEFKVSQVRAGRAPFYEPGLAELVAEQVAAGRLTATTELADAIPAADVALICVGTPSERNGNLGLDQLNRISGEIAALLPGRDRHSEVQSNFLAAVLAEAKKSNWHFEGCDYVTFKEKLNTIERMAEKLIALERVAPASRHGAAILLIRRLAEIFREATKDDPRQHIRSNRNKDTYQGKFFQMANDVLRRIGHKQSNAARGRMICTTLQQHYGPRKKNVSRRI